MCLTIDKAKHPDDQPITLERRKTNLFKKIKHIKTIIKRILCKISIKIA